jgi:chromosome segregation ATPase
MIITVEKLATVQTSIDKLVEQGQSLFTDIGETVRDRARLLQEVLNHEKTINDLNGEIADLQARNRDLELRNSRLVDDLMKFETQYNEASALLDNVRATVARPKPNGGAAKNDTHPVPLRPQGMLPRDNGTLR